MGISQALVAQYDDLSCSWQMLLEDHERETQSALDRKAYECEMSQRALADLLEASQRLQHDSEVLVEENHVGVPSFPR